MKSRKTLILVTSVVAAVGIVVSGCSSSGGSGSNASPADSGSAPAAPAGTSAAPAKTLTLKVGRLPCNTDCGFLRMSEEKGFYKKFGVDVKFSTFSSAAQIYPALASGDVDVIEQSPSGLFVASETGKGIQAKVVGSSMEGLPYAIYAKKSIGSVKDLQGKTVAISSATGLPAVVADLILSQAGVDLNKVKWVNGGSNADRYKAVVTGTADAASSPADFVPQAAKDGVKVLALSPDIIPDFPRYTILASDKAIQNNGDAITRYLAGLMDGLRYALDHQSEEEAISAKAMKTTADAPEITHMFDLVTKDKLINRDAEVPMAKLQYLNNALVKLGQLKKPVDLDSLVDTSLQEAAVKLVDQGS